MHRLLLTADWHLDRRAWARHPDATGDAFYALHQIRLLAAEYNVPVVAAGDLFDAADPDSYTVSLAVDALNLFPAPVYFVQGQHERSTPPWLNLSDRAVYLHARRVEVNGFSLSGWDYCADVGEAHQFLVAHPADLFVTHQVWAEAMDTAARSTGKLADLPVGCYRVLSGDYHEHRVTRHPREGGPDVELISPGSTHFRSVNEHPLKAVFLMRADGQLDTVRLDCRPVRSWTLRSEADLAGLLARPDDDLFDRHPNRPAEIDRPVLSVGVAAGVHAAAERLRERFPLAHLFVRPQAGDKEVDRPPPDRRSTGPGGVVARCLEALPVEPAVKADALSLLTATDPAAAAAAIHTRVAAATVPEAHHAGP